jgi:hypothetical protein
MKLLKGNLMQGAARVLVAVAAPVAVLGSMAAMNNGTSLAANEFAPVVTWLRDMLASDLTMVLALVVLLAGIWQLAHGGGYKTVGVILGVLAIALVGPGVLTTMSTSMPTVAQQQLIAHADLAPAAAPVNVLVAR